MTHEPSRHAAHPGAPPASLAVGQVSLGQPNMGGAGAIPPNSQMLPPSASGPGPRNQRSPTSPPKRKKAARPTTALPRRTTGPSRAYVATWATLAGVSMAYLAVLTVNPDAITAMGLPVIPGDPESNHGQRFTAKLASDVQTLQQSINELQGEVSALRGSSGIAVKAAARPGDFQALEAQPEPPKMQARLGTQLDGTRVAGMIITNPAPATVAAAPTGPIGLELVTGPSVDALRLNWGVLAERHGAMLKNLEVKYVAGGPSAPFKLLAGPVASVEAGAQICEQFRLKGTPCKVGAFVGNGF